jgi:Holliday junction resolvase-like predicted endonuclease
LRGEIDIIAQKKETTYFIEVKSSVTHETSNNGGGVSYETISPEENFHQYKAQKFLKTVQYYLYTMGKENSSVQIDLITVRINDTKNEAKIKRYENVV